MANKTDEELQAYLTALRECGVRAKAARAAGMTLRTVKQYLEADPEFAAEEELAFEEAADGLEEEARRRAVEGVPQLIMVNGELIEGSERKYSDGLLTLLLKGAKPDRYADRTKQELSGPGGKSIPLDDTAAAARLASILMAARTRRDAAGDVDDLLT